MGANVFGIQFFAVQDRQALSCLHKVYSLLLRFFGYNKENSASANKKENAKPKKPEISINEIVKTIEMMSKFRLGQEK